MVYVAMLPAKDGMESRGKEKKMFLVAEKDEWGLFLFRQFGDIVII